MAIESVQQYLQDHEVQKITIGQSGADLYDIDGNYILKHVSRECLKDRKRFDLYQRESTFYQVMKEQKLMCIPQILENKCTENEIVIFMKKYEIPRRDCIDDSILYRTMQALAIVHSCEIPSFLQEPHKTSEILSVEKRNACVKGWRSVLQEYRDSFDDCVLEEIAERINEVIVWRESAPQVLCHGDFHMDNLLLDKDKSIVICDWQGVGCGDASGDLSFFISRLDSDGIAVDKLHLAELYAKAMFEQSGVRIDTEQVLGQMYAANVITSFVFWHEYLHNSTKDRVDRIFNEMKENYRMILKLWQQERT